MASQKGPVATVGDQMAALTDTNGRFVAATILPAAEGMIRLASLAGRSCNDAGEVKTKGHSPIILAAPSPYHGHLTGTMNG